MGFLVFLVCFHFFSLDCVDLLTFLANRITSAFIMSGSTQSRDMLKACDRVWLGSRFHKLQSKGISGQIYSLQFFFSL